MLLVFLLVKLAVAASLASFLTRFGWFQRILMREDRMLSQRVQMALFCSLIFGAGVAARVVSRDNSYPAVDLGLEGSIVLGMLGGYVSGLTAGVVISIPAMFHGELMTMPLLAAAGVMGGLLRDVAPDKEFIWRFTPVPRPGDVPAAAQRRSALARLQHPVRVLHSRGGADAADRRQRLQRPRHTGSCSRRSGPTPEAGDGRDLRHHSVRRRAADQDLEQQSQREKAGAAADAAERGSAGRAQQPDPSALSVQHAELGHRADPPGPGTGARWWCKNCRGSCAGCCASRTT